MKYVASCSFGKDSLATVILAKKFNEPLDAVVYARVMYDEHRSAELPEHEEFIFNVAIPKLKSWGIETIVVDSPKTFKQCFSRKRSRGKNEGKVIGFPIPGRCDIARDCKLPAIKKAQQVFDGEDVTWYVGIAIDEPKRLARLRTDQVSLLAKYGLTEADAAELCKSEDLYSPSYSVTKRGGCFFCPNAQDTELLHLKNCHPCLWKDLLELDKTPNRVLNADGKAMFNRKETFTELDARLKGDSPK